MVLMRVLRTRAALLRAASASSSVAVARVTLRRQLLAASSARFASSSPSTPAVASTAKDAKDATAKAVENAAAAAAEESVDDVKIDLSTVGAEDAKVLTIADVLNAREQELTTNKALVDFEEWESISGTETVHDAVALMVERNIGSLIVMEANEGIVGIVTERDVLKKTSPRTVIHEEKVVHDVMSSHIMCIHPSTTVIDALATMTKENIRHLAVVSGDMTSAVKRGSVQEEDMQCVLSITDIVRAYAESEAQKKPQEPAASEATSTEAKAKPESEQKGVKKTDETAASPSATASATEDAAAEASKATEAATETTPVVTAATLLKKKHKRIKLILNTRAEDNVTVAEAVEEMAKRDFGAVLVVDKEQRVQGIFTERDYIRKVLFQHQDPTQVRVTDVMSPVVSCLQIEDSLEKCWNQAATSNCRHFPVIGVMRKDREKELAGILSIKDIVREISKDHQATPGFRLMEFFKSKMEPKPVEPKPVEPKPVEPVAESRPEEAAAPPAEKKAEELKAEEPKPEEPKTPAKEAKPAESTSTSQ